MKKEVDKKKLLFDTAFVMAGYTVGYIIDLTLEDYNINILYSFGMLFLLLCMDMRSKRGKELNGASGLFIKICIYIVFPILSKLLDIYFT